MKNQKARSVHQTTVSEFFMYQSNQVCGKTNLSGSHGNKDDQMAMLVHCILVPLDLKESCRCKMNEHVQLFTEAGVWKRKSYSDHIAPVFMVITYV